jgi:hypothetical protein
MPFRAVGSSIIRVLDFDRRSIPGVLKAVALTSAAALLLSILRWPLVAVLTTFLEPLLELIVLAAFVISVGWAVAHAQTVLLRFFSGLRRRRF